MATNLFDMSREIRRREDFGDLLNRRGLTGSAVEIGTHLGEFAEQILLQWQGKMLYCVDPWQDRLPDYDDPIAPRDRQADYRAAIKRLAPYGDHCELIRMLSHDAASCFENESLDFVYIDGNHAYPFVKQDIADYWPKVKPGGILAGHDLDHEWAKTVRVAVEQFLMAHNKRAFVVLGDAQSWYIIKD